MPGAQRVHFPVDRFQFHSSFTPPKPESFHKQEGCPSTSRSSPFSCSVSWLLHSLAAFSSICSRANTPDGNNNDLRVLTTGEHRVMLVSPCLFVQDMSPIRYLRPVPCSTYLCPDTLVCVDAPSQCPCPNVEDIRCIIPDVHNKNAGTVICVRGGGCEDVDDYMNAWS